MPEEPKKNDDAGQSAKPLHPTVKTAVIIVLVAALGWMMLKSSLFKPEMYETAGDTMGTKYYVKVCADSSWGWERTQTAIETELLRVNRMMSTFLDDSEIVTFNDNPSVDWIPASPEMVGLVRLSKEAAEIVDGKFDITVGPLVDLWGFGKKRRTLAIPPPLADIVKVQEICGLDKLEYREESPGVKPALKKAVPELRIDLSGVAKGYGVDCVAAVLEKRGYVNYMIEIGGETRTRGHKVVLQDNQGWLSMFAAEKLEEPWLIGIQEPVPVEQFEDPPVVLAVNLNDRAMATSGDAHNTKEIGGQRYTHIIDPRTGSALTSEDLGTGVEGEELGSVSVIADTCAEADARATGFYLLGV
jgi:thiamine biosynthesis lipoprotein